MSKKRLDQVLVELGLVATRSQAESYIKLGEVTVNKHIVTKPGYLVSENDIKNVRISAIEQYVSRAALKLASVTRGLNVEFNNKIVLDVGSSTGGFTDYALRSGAAKVIAVDIGTEQLHPSLRNNTKIELHEKTDIRNFKTNEKIDIVVIDVSFISLREILPKIISNTTEHTQVVAMVKPQFEAVESSLKHKGVIKNDRVRRQILKEFEQWVYSYFVIQNKLDSAISGAKGNQERFYLMRKA
jgi:23S rRNA (cytidine1920-2'-O)/16S rRNA (cytidine1409-2'-O)-methyltransferase